MVSVELQGDEIVIRPQGWYRLWALRRELRIPRGSVRRARLMTRQKAADGRGVRVAGTALPGLVMAGSFWSPSAGWEFWVTGRAQQFLVLDIAGLRYRRLVLQPENPEALVAQLAL